MAETTSDIVTAAIEAGRESYDVQHRIATVQADDGEAVPVCLVPGGSTLQLPLQALQASLKLAGQPQRMRGMARHQELQSFVDHLNRFKQPGSVVWADTAAVTLLGVIDYSEQSKPRWAEHRSLYACPLAPEWRTWFDHNELNMSQDAFADFLESVSADLVAPGKDEEFPPPVRLLELVRNLRIYTKGTFERSTNPTTGESSLVAKNENDVNSTRIPPLFLIGIPVFEAGAKYRLVVRLRFKLAEGRPVFSYQLDQADAVKRDAFGEIRAQVAEKTGLPVYAGTPEPTPELSI